MKAATPLPVKNLLRKGGIAWAAIMLSLMAAAQTDTTNPNSLEGLSLKDLLDIKIVSASKKIESLFDAPLSASVVTIEDIRRAGCNSIMEALRLVPGMIVREQSNGNYDIHLRGMDNLPPNTSFDLTSNTTTLVMIDNRPVYSYLRGGTFWETLPVDLNDVEKIEVVRGAAAALYGPNAVNGVINIITRKATKDGLYMVANSQLGSFKTRINNASIGYRTGKWSVIASGNFQGRERTQTSVFEYFRNRYIDNPECLVSFSNDTLKEVEAFYPQPSLAMKKYAGNLLADYNPGGKISFSLSSGIQHSAAMRVSTENAYSPLSYTTSDSRYVDAKASVKGFTAQIAYNRGTQTIEQAAGNKYDFSTLDAGIEYNFTRGNFSLRPGLSYRKAIYDDTRYSDTINKTGIFNARGDITTQSASLRGEYKLLNEKLRLVAGIMANKFNYPDTNYLSYQLAATYKLNKNNIFRFVASRAPRSSNIYDTYVNQHVVFYPIGYKKYVHVALIGNKNLQLLTADMLELGYRGAIGNQLNIDVELFNIKAREINNLVDHPPYFSMRGTDTVLNIMIYAENIPLRLDQKGITVSLNWRLPQLQIRPFVTIQESMMQNYDSFHVSEGPIPPVYLVTNKKTRLEGTPTIFGGASVNYAPGSKLNVNLNAYYYSKQTYYHFSNYMLNDGVRGIDHIPAKFLLNASISYELISGLRLFCTGKNLLNNKSREFFGTDSAPFALFGGVNFEF
jgi:iron complex outermembrane recepter protein